MLCGMVVGAGFLAAVDDTVVRRTIACCCSPPCPCRGFHRCAPAARRRQYAPSRRRSDDVRSLPRSPVWRPGKDAFFLLSVPIYGYK